MTNLHGYNIKCSVPAILSVAARSPRKHKRAVLSLLPLAILRVTIALPLTAFACVAWVLALPLKLADATGDWFWHAWTRRCNEFLSRVKDIDAGELPEGMN